MKTNTKTNHPAGPAGKNNANQSSFHALLEDRQYHDLVEYARNHHTESFDDYLQTVVQYTYRIENLGF